MAEKLGKPIIKVGSRFRRLNLFHRRDAEIAIVILDGGFRIKGFQNADLRERIADYRVTNHQTRLSVAVRRPG